MTDAARRTFRRAMRRHEKRARRMGLPGAVHVFAGLRRDPASVPDVATVGDELRAVARERDDLSATDRRLNMGLAFLYDRAADAVAKLRSAS